MLCAICRHLWRCYKAEAVWMLTVWALCCRPGEALKIRKMDVTAPTSLCPHWIVVLHADPDPVGLPHTNVLRDEKKTSKVGVMDEAVIVDQPYMKGLKILKTLTQHKSDTEKIFTFDPDHAAKVFTRAVTHLGFDHHGINCAYQIRHGSASTDVLTGLRSLTDVQKRGRWEVAKSVRRYSNGGRLSQVYDGLDEKQKLVSVNAEVWMQRILERGNLHAEP